MIGCGINIYDFSKMKNLNVNFSALTLTYHIIQNGPFVIRSSM